ncbi:flagellar biosynthesis protein A [Clostridium acetobutylicum EA 2018]|nr:flagellar biosynthesis protein A [Clostridium acetobutylicum EA 2018]AEI32539.1 flagellar biosynthesis protein A [Clostridium acetobutylicum DSM 1731]AWV78870.1 flagellar biosynthesis protein [Clostridium acetobutylicum]PSM06830.1 flagellar biosynthesis protein [Clostridium sp. NJ4]MBC2395107.1 flagellar biosynthesis protein [Clostridium acetobutylicum]
MRKNKTYYISACVCFAGLMFLFASIVSKNNHLLGNKLYIISTGFFTVAAIFSYHKKK